VETTDNRAERALRCAVTWRKRSQGTVTEKGARWVERILSLKDTWRLQAHSTYTVLAEPSAATSTGNSQIRPGSHSLSANSASL
jgi:hypothetical protein